MKRIQTLFIPLFLAAAALAAGPSAEGATAPGVKECQECHGDRTIEKSLPGGKTQSLFVDEKAYRNSVHGKGACTTCHADAKAPHDKLEKVSCGKCHPDAEKSYLRSNHGKGHAKANEEMAWCTDCHGKHDIRRHKDPAAMTFRLNIVGVCLRCHKDRAIEDKYKLPGQEVMEAYETSVHGLALKKSGLMGTAVCPDCHGNHTILPGDRPQSATHRQNIPTLCGKCHPGILEKYERSVHGKGMRGGITDSPVCTDCHGEHRITKITDPTSPVYAKNIPKTCASDRCHENAGISSRYALPKKRFSTYMDSFHGIALEYGMTKAASCASCHGFHDILPSSDPASSIHKENIPRTCGKCHPNAGPNFAKGAIHVEVSPQKAMGVFAVRVFYTIFISSLVILFVLHVGLELHGRRRRKRKEEGKAEEGKKE